MRIASAQVQMVGAHQSTVRHEVRQRLTVVAPEAVVAPAPAAAPPTTAASAPSATGPGAETPSADRATDAPPVPFTALRGIRGGLRPASNGARAPGDLDAALGALRASTRARIAQSGAHAPAASSSPSAAKGSDDAADGEATSGDDLKTAIVRQLFERMTGKKMSIGDLEKALARIHAGDPGAQVSLTTPGREAAGLAGDIEMPGPVAGLRFERVERTEEAETTSFSARAVVTTADGQALEVGVDLVLSRHFLDESRITLEAGQVQGGRAGASGGKAKDPLVLNFDAPAASLTEGTVAFDLDSDGRPDDIHFLGEGSGFVALDKNGNGRIDDGSELFGAQSGDGFAELAAYDDDGNGWIDEGDAVFDALKIWSKDAAGEDSLATLKARNVGALYLGKVNAPYNYKGQDNENVAQMRSAGFYVGEVGHRAGSLQQLDLVV